MILPADPFAADAPLPRVAPVTSRARSVWALVRAERIDLPGGGFALVCWESWAVDRGPYRLMWGTVPAITIMDPGYDGWREIARQLGHTLSMCITDPPADRDALVGLYHAIGRAVAALGPLSTPREIERHARADLAEWARFDAEIAAEQALADALPRCPKCDGAGTHAEGPCLDCDGRGHSPDPLPF